MAIRIDPNVSPVIPGMLQPSNPQMPTVQPVPSQSGATISQPEQGANAVDVQNEQSSVDSDPQGLNIPHDQRDRNKGAGIRI